jgi:hypothetical protein
MKKLMFISLACLPLLTTLSGMQEEKEDKAAVVKLEEINNNVIDAVTLDHKIIIKGSCILDHDLNIEQGGMLILASNAQLIVEGSITGLRRNSLFFTDKSSTIIIGGNILFDFAEDHKFAKGSLRILDQSTLVFSSLSLDNPITIKLALDSFDVILGSDAKLKFLGGIIVKTK